MKISRYRKRQFVGTVLLLVLLGRSKKMKKLFFVISFVALLALVSNVSAESYSWKTGLVNGDWFTSTNWTVAPPSGAPLITDGTSMHNAGTVPTTPANGIFINSGDATTLELRVGGAANPTSLESDKFGYLTMNGGTLTTANWLMAGTDSPGLRSGEIIMNGGSMTLGTGTRTSGHLYIGSGFSTMTSANIITGILRMSGGTINAGGTFGVAKNHTSGYVYLDGGTIYCNNFTIKEDNGAGTAYMNITGDGKVIINGDKTAAVAGYIAAGWLTGNGNDLDIQYDYNPATNKTKVYAAYLYLCTVPGVVGQPKDAACATIESANLVCGMWYTTDCSATIPAGNVISTAPAGGKKVECDSAVDIVVSTGPCLCTVPGVVGQTQANAEAAIVSNGLVVGNVTTQCDNTVPAGSVISQNPAGGEAECGTAVGILLSIGPSDGACASNPIPPDGATNVKKVPHPLSPSIITLSWTPGEGAEEHDLYIGDDEDAVTNANTDTKGIYLARWPVGNCNYVLSWAKAGTTYYWRVDEVKKNKVCCPGQVWKFTVTPPDRDFQAGTDEETKVKQAINLLRNSNYGNVADELENMMKNKAADNMNQLRQAGNMTGIGGDTTDARIRIGLPPQKDIVIDITAPIGFWQLTMLAQTLYHEWVHWRHYQQDADAYEGAPDQSFANCHPKWDEVEAYYKEIKLKLEWKFDRKQRLSQIPGYENMPGTPTPQQRAEAEQLRKELKVIENQISTVLSDPTLLGKQHEIDGKKIKKRYEGDSNPLEDAFAKLQTDQEKYNEIVSRLNDVRKIDKDEESQKSIEEKINEIMEKYSENEKDSEQGFIPSDEGGTVELAVSENGYSHSFEMAIEAGTLYASTVITATWMDSNFIEPWTAWGRGVLSPAYQLSAPTGAVANPDYYPSRVSLTYNPELAGDREFHIYQLRSTTEDDKGGGNGPLWKPLIAESIDYNVGVISAYTIDPFGLYVVMEQMPELIADHPAPAEGREDVRPDVVLIWSPGECVQQTAGHDVYLGTNYVSVRDANRFDATGIYRGVRDVNYYVPSETLNFSVTYYWRIDEINDVNIWQGPVWWFKTPEGRAHAPQPTDGWWNIPIDTVLNWKPGFLATSHDVYFGTDFDDINEANRTIPRGVLVSQDQDANNYAPETLEFNKTYFWRVDEVNDACSADIRRGDIWSFTTSYYVLVDDFDADKNDVDLHSRWGDPNDHPECSPNGTGGRVYDSNDEMLYVYDNNGDTNGSDFYSEVRRDFGHAGADWTKTTILQSLKALGIYFKGNPNNCADPQYDRMYVGLEDTRGVYVQVYHSDPNAQRTPTWQEWKIELREFSDAGVDLNSVRYLSIGFGARCNSTVLDGGEGEVVFDDIRLYPRHCVPEYGPVADFTDDCVVNWADVKVMSEEWLTEGIDADIYPEGSPDGIVDFRDFAMLAEQWLEEFLWP
jgi:hypothetical protein